MRALLGENFAHFQELGEHPEFGVPVTDECPGLDGARYTQLSGTEDAGEASVYWREDHGSKLLAGAVREHWAAADWEGGTYGFPTSDSGPLPGDTGWVAHFTGDDDQGASIYSHVDAGTWGVKGEIRLAWFDRGAEQSEEFGFPVSDEYVTDDGLLRSDFERGSITYDPNTGEFGFPSTTAESAPPGPSGT